MAEDLTASGVGIPLRPSEVASLAAHREARVPLPDGPPAIEFGMDDDRIIFRDQVALDEYVRGAALPHAEALRLAADELEQAHHAGQEIDVSWWWLRDRAEDLTRTSNGGEDRG